MYETIFMAMAIVSTCMLTSCIRFPDSTQRRCARVYVLVLFWVCHDFPTIYRQTADARPRTLI